MFSSTNTIVVNLALLAVVSSAAFLGLRVVSGFEQAETTNRQLVALNKISLSFVRTVFDCNDFQTATNPDEEKAAMDHYEANYKQLAAAMDSALQTPGNDAEVTALLGDVRKTSRRIDRIIHKMRAIWISKSSDRLQQLLKYRTMMIGLARTTEYARNLDNKLSAINAKLEYLAEHNKTSQVLKLFW